MVSLIFLPAQAAAEAAVETSAGIGALGLDIRALLFQVANFAILLFLLKRFAYKPILKVLQARRERVEESLRTAHEVTEMKKKMTVEQERLIGEAQLGVQRVLARGQEQAEALLKEARRKAQEQADQIVAEGTARLSQEEIRLRQELGKEARGLVREATRRLIGQHFTPADDEKLVARTIKELQK